MAYTLTLRALDLPRPTETVPARFRCPDEAALLELLAGGWDVPTHTARRWLAEPGRAHPFASQGWPYEAVIQTG